MGQLEERLGELPNTAVLARYLRDVHHYVGRLGHHIRATQEVIRDAAHLEDVFRGTWEVDKIPMPVCAPAPQADNHTHLPGIMNRMIRPHEKERWSQVIASGDRLSVLIPESRLVEYYDGQQSEPRVHCEVQALEHFHQNSLRFAWNDRFIATSKMACFCCKLYFRHHPLHPEEPESHEKLYVNWGPIYLPGGRDHPDFAAHRQLLTKVIDGIRDKVLDRLLRLTENWSFHHDSVTGITTANGLHGGNAESDLGNSVPFSSGKTLLFLGMVLGIFLGVFLGIKIT